jgi:hypothetical protein
LLLLSVGLSFNSRLLVIKFLGKSKAIDSGSTVV